MRMMRSRAEVTKRFLKKRSSLDSYIVHIGLEGEREQRCAFCLSVECLYMEEILFDAPVHLVFVAYSDLTLYILIIGILKVKRFRGQVLSHTLATSTMSHAHGPEKVEVKAIASKFIFRSTIPYRPI